MEKIDAPGADASHAFTLLLLSEVVKDEEVRPQHFMQTDRVLASVWIFCSNLDPPAFVFAFELSVKEGHW